MKYLSILIVVLMAAAVGWAKELGNSGNKSELESDASHGTGMSADDAKRLEDVLTKTQDNLPARAKLLGYYMMKQHGSKDARETYRRHVLWVIEHCPESGIAGTPYCELDDILDPAGYREGKELWLAQIKEHAKDAAILGNAANYFFLPDKKLAEKLLKQAAEIEPENPRWHDLLGHLYALQHEPGGGAKSLAELERANSIDSSDDSKTSRLVELAKSAYDAGEMEKAKKYAEELLKTGAKDPQNWNYGNAIHHGNNVLGRIALQQGQIPQADEFLLKAGDTPGSPQLDSFGPNMSLAKELLEAGQKDTVLQYFGRCRKFWKMGGGKLDDWSQQVKDGKTPKFGANLVY